jgi:Glycosyltransferase
MFVDALHRDFETVYAPVWNGFFAGSPDHANVRVERPETVADVAVFDALSESSPDAKRRVFIMHCETPAFSCGHYSEIRKAFAWATDVVWVTAHKRATFESVLLFSNEQSGFDGPLPRFHTIPFWIPTHATSNPKRGLVGTIVNGMTPEKVEFWNACADGLQDLVVVGYHNEIENVKRVSPYGRGEYIGAIQQIDVFLNTVIGNSFGMAVLEAMACGIPVVTSTSRDIPVEFVSEVNILMCGNRGHAAVEETRGYIRRLLSDRGFRDQVGDAGRETVRELYSLDRFQSAFRNVMFR